MYGEIFMRNVHASGVIPQISLIMGPCAGGAVYSPAITDFTVMVDQTSHMFITGPDVIKTVTGEDVAFEDLGGARTHNTKSGVAHYMAERRSTTPWTTCAIAAGPPAQQQPTEPPTCAYVEADLEITDEDRELDTFLPDSVNQPYDMHTVIEHVVDDGDFLEVQPTVRAEPAHRVRPGRGPRGRDRRQPAHAVRRHPRHRRLARRPPASFAPATLSTSPS